MKTRHNEVDKARNEIINYLCIHNITEREWNFINQYIEQKYYEESCKTTLKNLTTSEEK